MSYCYGPNLLVDYVNKIIRLTKCYYFIILLFGLFTAVPVQKSVRDQLRGMPGTDMFKRILEISVSLKKWKTQMKIFN